MTESSVNPYTRVGGAAVEAVYESQQSFIKWFYFGLHIKRWLLVLLVGVAIMGLGFGYLLREVYVTYTFPGVG